MYNERIESLIKAALADGVLTEKEKQILFRRAQECGIDLDEFEMVLDARLAEMKKQQKPSAPSSEKLGNMRKCPACGALMPALATSCGECGYELSGIEATASVVILSQKIEEIEKTISLQKEQARTVFFHDDISLKENLKRIEKDRIDQIKSAIDRFPIPNAKNDLFDLMIWLREQGYQKKYNECVKKVQYLFSNDSLFTEIIDNYKLQTAKKKRRKLILPAIILSIILIPCIILTIESAVYNNRLDKFDTFISNGDAESAKQVLQKMGLDHFDPALDLIELFIDNGDVTNAIYVYERLTPGYSSYNGYYDRNNNHHFMYEYTECAGLLLAQGLIRIGDYDAALDYYPCSWGFDNNASCDKYYDFMVMVVEHLCKTDKKNEARKFVDEYALWFKDKIDNCGDIGVLKGYGKNFTYAKSRSRLLDIISRY